MFQSNRRCMLLIEFFLYLTLRFVGKLGGNGVCEIWVKDGVKGSERICGSDEVVSDETSIKSLCHPIWEMFCSSWGIKRLFSKLFGQSCMSFFKCVWIVFKKMVVDDWGLIVWLFIGVVGGSWDAVVGDWCGGCWLAILEKFWKIIY